MHFAGHEQIVSAFLSNSHRGSLFSHPDGKALCTSPCKITLLGPSPKAARWNRSCCCRWGSASGGLWKQPGQGQKQQWSSLCLTSASRSLMAAQNWTEFFFILWKIKTLHLPIPVYCLWKWENATGIYVPQIKLHENYLLPPLPKSILSNRHFTYAFNYCVDQLTHRSEGGDELQQSNKRFTGMDTHIRVL